MQACIFGLIHHPHATATKLFDNAVVGDGSADKVSESATVPLFKSSYQIIIGSETQ
jgi:hypothetical protein